MEDLVERQLVERAAEYISSYDLITARQREIEREISINTDLFLCALDWGTCTDDEYVSVKFSDRGFDDDTPANFVAEDPISFFGIKDVV